MYIVLPLIEESVILHIKKGCAMKRILVTGVNSYIGNAVERYLGEFNAREGRECYRIDKISLRDGSWEDMAFGAYDAVLHVAGIAHADIGKVSEETKALYYQVNCDLAVKVAEKAKAEGVQQFVYLSSVIVYGDSAKVGGTKHITAETQPRPANFYGDSKWQAEQKLRELEAAGTSEQASQDVPTDELPFHVAIIRPPMVYGKGSKGNFPMLVKLAEKMPVFPDIPNQRSMIYVGNLAEYIRLLIENGKGGTFLPQNAEYVTTAQMVRTIGTVKNKKVRLWKILNPLVKLAAVVPGKIGGMANKAFGSLTIDRALSEQDLQGYQIYSLEESIRRSV